MGGGYLVLGREAADADAFNAVFAVHREYVYCLTYALLGNTQDAEDVTQDVFLGVYRALPSYQPERASMRTWLTRLTVNACRMHRRRNFARGFWQRTFCGNGSHEDVVDLSPWIAPEEHAMRMELRQVLRHILSKLRYEHRIVLVLHYYLDLSCPEIARITDCPEGTVYSRLHYARNVVQAHFERQAQSNDNEVKSDESKLRSDR